MSNKEYLLPRDSLKNISMSQPNINKSAIYPVNRKMKFIDVDKSVQILINRGWKNITNQKTPNTTDTVMFKSGNIIPVEFKWRNKENPASKSGKGKTNTSIAKKLATFVANIYVIHGRAITEFWAVTSFLEGDDIRKHVTDKAIGMIENCSWIEDKKKMKKIINAVKIKQIDAKELNEMKLDGYNKTPKWFSNAYELKEPKIKNISAKQIKENLKVESKNKTKTPVKKKHNKVKNVDNLVISINEFEEYKSQQKFFQDKLVKAIGDLTKEISNIRKDSKSRVFTIKSKN